MGLFRLPADKIAQVIGVRTQKRIRGKLHSILEKLDHGHHVLPEANLTGGQTGISETRIDTRTCRCLFSCIHCRSLLARNVREIRHLRSRDPNSSPHLIPPFLWHEGERADNAIVLRTRHRWNTSRSRYDQGTRACRG
jgi:hypothetical protein